MFRIINFLRVSPCFSVHLRVTALFLFVSLNLSAQKNPVFDLIPQVDPLFKSVKEFSLRDTIFVYHQPDKKGNAEYLKFLFGKYFGDSYAVVLGEFETYLEHESPYKYYDLQSPRIMLFEDSKKGNSEFYHLEVEEEVLSIDGGEIGLKRGMNTLIQLIGVENDYFKFAPVQQKENYNFKRAKKSIGSPLDSTNLIQTKQWISLQPMIIDDHPKFNHRGMLLDCARHFFSVETVKKYLDLMALYKMNVLHWHLTEDQGWRIEIDKYPNLTKIGAWRTEKDGTKYGGFYTKKEIREIVAYAMERGITVIPEIELPGHSQAAIASYPWLSCTGEKVEVVNDWGVFKEIYCAGNDSTFEFLENVLMEVMELFPSKYIHIGGDEAPKYRWEHCDKCQNRIQTENLKDEHELQSYFIQRIEKFLQKNGRELIGWDEILEGGLSATATVQSWRGFEGGIKAAENGNGVVMSPTSHCYFDYGLQSIDLKKVYEFNPIPSELEEQFHKNILGGECNLWSEHIPDEANLDSKVFPRILAMSEVLWAAPEKRNYAEFYNRVQEHYPLLEKLKVKYGLETTPAKIQTFIKEGKIYATMVSEIPNATYEIRWDGKEMELDGDFTQFEKLEKDTFEVKDWKLSVKVLKNGKPYGEKVEQFFEFHKAIGAKVTYHSNFSRWYPAAGEQALVDGRTGIIDFKDGNWQGFWGEPIDVELDLREVKEFNSVFMRFNQYQNSWIFRPKAMKIEISEDGENWNNFLEKEFGEEKPYNKKMIWNDVGTNFLIQKAQYIRIHVENYGKVPDWHEAAGQDCWLFLDEIIVK